MKLSVLIPAKNQSEKLIRHLEESILPCFDKKGITYDVLLCLDGGSQEEFDKIANHSFPGHVKLLPLLGKKGKGHAVKRLIQESNADYGIFMDADLATKLEVFDGMEKDLGKIDLLIASRDAKGSSYIRKQPFMRRLTHWGCRMVVKMMFHMKGIKDTQCGYKCLRLSIGKEICKKSIIDGFAFDVELVYGFFMNGYSVREYPCVWDDDPDSSVGSPIATSKKFFKDLRLIKKNRKAYALEGAKDAH